VRVAGFFGGAEGGWSVGRDRGHLRCRALAAASVGSFLEGPHAAPSSMSRWEPPLRAAPGTDPSGRNYRTGLLPRVHHHQASHGISRVPCGAFPYMLGAGVVRWTFTVKLFHLQHLAGLPALPPAPFFALPMAITAPAEHPFAVSASPDDPQLQGWLTTTRISTRLGAARAGSILSPSSKSTFNGWRRQQKRR